METRKTDEKPKQPMSNTAALVQWLHEQSGNFVHSGETRRLMKSAGERLMVLQNGLEAIASGVACLPGYSAAEAQQEAITSLDGDVARAPIPMLLYCDGCSAPHVDEGEWATRPHKTHQCQHCGNEWRPANVPTVGVNSLNNPGEESQS